MMLSVLAVKPVWKLALTVVSAYTTVDTEKMPLSDAKVSSADFLDYIHFNVIRILILL